MKVLYLIYYVIKYIKSYIHITFINFIQCNLCILFITDVMFDIEYNYFNSQCNNIGTMLRAFYVFFLHNNDCKKTADDKKNTVDYKRKRDINWKLQRETRKKERKTRMKYRFLIVEYIPENVATS